MKISLNRWGLAEPGNKFPGWVGWLPRLCRGGCAGYAVGARIS
jgi:hypothetical protein